MHISDNGGVEESLELEHCRYLARHRRDRQQASNKFLVLFKYSYGHSPDGEERDGEGRDDTGRRGRGRQERYGDRDHERDGERSGEERRDTGRFGKRSRRRRKGEKTDGDLERDGEEEVRRAENYEKERSQNQEQQVHLMCRLARCALVLASLQREKHREKRREAYRYTQLISWEGELAV